MDFRWNEWNLEHATRHGVRPEEAEFVARTAQRPWPEAREDDKRLVWGPGQDGRLLQVIYVLDDLDVAYVIHSRPLTTKEKASYRRRRRP